MIVRMKADDVLGVPWDLADATGSDLPGSRAGKSLG